MLTKLGVGQNAPLHLWDHDKVESHNPANQAYNPADIGVPKVIALRQHVENWSGQSAKIITHEAAVKELVPLEGVVFLCLDSMSARMEICESSVFNNSAIKLCVETRMDASFAFVTVFDPNDASHIYWWKENWYPDDQTQNTVGCGGHQSVITAVDITAAFAVQSFIAWSSKQSFTGFPNMLSLNLQTWNIRVNHWPVLDQ